VKPLIKVDGRPIIEHVVNMFSNEDDFVFICNKQHLETTDMRNHLERICPKGKIIPIAPHKLGPVYAVLQAESEIQNDVPTTVNYCDFAVYWDYKQFKQQMLDLQCDGCVTCYKGFHPHLLFPNLYAGVKTDRDNYLIDIQEKHSFTPNKMDTYQSSGTYYFRKGSLVKKYFKRLMDKKISLNNEYYVSMVYNLLQEDRLQTYIYDLDYFCQWGTPEDLEIYNSWSDYFAYLGR